MGLLNEGMRFRDLETGVFLTRDPIGYGDGPNVYCYVHCNPIMSFDPYGLETHTPDFYNSPVFGVSYNAYKEPSDPGYSAETSYYVEKNIPYVHKRTYDKTPFGIRNDTGWDTVKADMNNPSERKGFDTHSDGSITRASIDKVSRPETLKGPDLVKFSQKVGESSPAVEAMGKFSSEVAMLLIPGVNLYKGSSLLIKGGVFIGKELGKSAFKQQCENGEEKGSVLVFKY